MSGDTSGEWRVPAGMKRQDHCCSECEESFGFVLVKDTRREPDVVDYEWCKNHRHEDGHDETYTPKYSPAEHLAALVFAEVAASIAAGDVRAPAHDDLCSSVEELDALVEHMSGDTSWWDASAWSAFVRHAERSMPALLASIRAAAEVSS